MAFGKKKGKKKEKKGKEKKGKKGGSKTKTKTKTKSKKNDTSTTPTQSKGSSSAGSSSDSTSQKKKTTKQKGKGKGAKGGKKKGKKGGRRGRGSESEEKSEHMYRSAFTDKAGTQSTRKGKKGKGKGKETRSKKRFESGELSSSFDAYDADYFRVGTTKLGRKLKRAALLREEGSFGASLKLLKPLAKKYPQESQVKDELGVTYMAMGKYDKAYDAFTAAIEHHPSFLIYGHRALCEVRLGQYTPALHDYDTAIDLVCDDSRATNEIFNELKHGRKLAAKLARAEWSASESLTGSGSSSSSSSSS